MGYHNMTENLYTLYDLLGDARQVRDAAKCRALKDAVERLRRDIEKHPDFLNDYRFPVTQLEDYS